MGPLAWDGQLYLLAVSCFVVSWELDEATSLHPRVGLLWPSVSSGWPRLVHMSSQHPKSSQGWSLMPSHSQNVC